MRIKALLICKKLYNFNYFFCNIIIFSANILSILFNRTYNGIKNIILNNCINI